MSKVIIALHTIILFLTIETDAQDATTIQTNDRLVIKSKVLNEDRTILIRTPTDYARSTNKYPVAYMLDGQFYRINLATGIIDNLVLAGFVPDMILVSIPNTDRGRDMTPTKMQDRPTSGGADNFLRFLETELIPTIENKYRVQPHRTIVGHSLSGLFVVYAFASRPELFNAYLAASPHLQWDNHFVLRHAGELLKSKMDLKKTLFVGLGDEPEYLNGFNGFREILKGINIKSFDYEFREIPGENHSSINIPVFHFGFKKVWKDLYIDRSASAIASSSTLSEVENHYKTASEKFGYEILIPEDFLNNLGYRLMRQNNFAAALQVFERNTQLYPASPNAYDSFAEALERDGQLRKAKENFEIGVRLAEESGNLELARTIKENLQRIIHKLRDQK